MSNVMGSTTYYGSHWVIFVDAGAPKKTWFLINLCPFWHFGPCNLWGYDSNDFRFSGKLPPNAIRTIPKNKNDWGVFKGVALLQSTFKKKKNGILGQFFAHWMWCKWAPNNLKLPEILYFI